MRYRMRRRQQQERLESNPFPTLWQENQQTVRDDFAGFCIRQLGQIKDIDVESGRYSQELKHLPHLMMKLWSFVERTPTRMIKQPAWAISLTIYHVCKYFNLADESYNPRDVVSAVIYLSDILPSQPRIMAQNYANTLWAFGRLAQYGWLVDVKQKVFPIIKKIINKLAAFASTGRTVEIQNFTNALWALGKLAEADIINSEQVSSIFIDIQSLASQLMGKIEKNERIIAQNYVNAIWGLGVVTFLLQEQHEEKEKSLAIKKHMKTLVNLYRDMPAVQNPQSEIHNTQVMQGLALSNMDDDEDLKPFYRAILSQVVTRDCSETTQCKTLVGLERQAIPSGDDCLYKAVTYYIFGEENVALLYNLVADNFRQNTEQYKEFHPLQTSPSIQSYVTGLKTAFNWREKTDINILMELINRPIAIIGEDGAIKNKEAVARYPECEPVFVFCDGKARYEQRSHYDAMLLREGCDGKTILHELLTKSEVTVEQQLTLSYQYRKTADEDKTAKKTLRRIPVNAKINADIAAELQIKPLQCEIEYFIAGYPVDIFFEDIGLIIEIDGKHHDYLPKQIVDDFRDRVFRNKGYRVERIKLKGQSVQQLAACVVEIVNRIKTDHSTVQLPTSPLHHVQSFQSTLFDPTHSHKRTRENEDYAEDEGKTKRQAFARQSQTEEIWIERKPLEHPHHHHKHRHHKHHHHHKRHDRTHHHKTMH